MNKQNFKFLMVFSISVCLFVSSASLGRATMVISTLEIEDIDWIAPNVSQIGLGLEPEFAYNADGSMEVIYINPEAYSDELLYITNSSSDWSDPVVVADPQYGAENPSILIDSNNVTHICYRADGGAAYHVNNSDGTWATESMGGGSLMSSFPQMAIGPDNVIHYVYTWFQSSSNDYSGGTTYINNSKFEPQNTDNPITRFEQFADIAVDSAGLVHLVYEGSWNNTVLGPIAVRDIYYQTFDPNASENAFSSPIRLTDVQSTGDYAQRPQIICDDHDDLHVVFIETEPEMQNGIQVHRAYVKYMLIDSDPSSEDIQTINNFRSTTSTPDMAIDSKGNVHIVYDCYPLGEYSHYYESDIAYATNETGSWINERVTNQPYGVGWPSIDINPLNDQPTILYLIKQEYTVEGYTMEYVERVNSTFGNHFTMSTYLPEENEAVSLVEEEAYAYILLGYNTPIEFTMILTNPTEETLSYDLDLVLIENDFVSLVNGTLSRPLDSLNAEESLTYSWFFEVSRGQMSELEFQVLTNDEIIGKVIYTFNIGSSGGSGISIPFSNFMGISMLLGLASCGLVLKNRKFSKK